MLYPLSDVHVLEVGKNVTAPYCTKLLAGLGAEVIKIEPPNGDPSRTAGPFPKDEPHSEKSGLFLYLNTGKKSVTLNLDTKEGRGIFLELASRVDILVENLGAGVFDRLGLNYATLEKTNPHLVVTSVSPFGQTGPYRNWQAEDITIEAMSGTMITQGNPEREPLKLAGRTFEYRTGASAFTASLFGFYHAEETGEGDYIDVSEMEVGVGDDFTAVEVFQARGENLTRQKAVLLLPCKDGWVYFRVFPHEWSRFTKLLGFDIENDDRFLTMEKRRQNAEELNNIIFPLIVERSKEEIYNWAQAANITVGYVADICDVVQSAQYKSRGFFVEINHPATGKLCYPGNPVTIGDTPWSHVRAPLLGEHNVEIISKLLGYTPDELVHLRQIGVI